MSSYWEKLVDLYVDDECSNEERSAVEARAEIDSNVNRAIREAKELRSLLREIPGKPPKEFESRLRDAIMNAPSWEEKRAINISRTSDFFTRASRRVLSPAGIGTVAAVAICAVVLFACLTLTKNKPAEQGTPLAQVEQAAKSEESTTTPSEPWKLIPSPEGNAPESASKAESQGNFWAIVRVDDKIQAQKCKQNLQTRCAELNVSFSKSGEDEQLRLRNVSKEQWLKIAEGWNELECERSEALENWLEEAQETQTIRVTFKLNTN